MKHRHFLAAFLSYHLAVGALLAATIHANATTTIQIPTGPTTETDEAKYREMFLTRFSYNVHSTGKYEELAWMEFFSNVYDKATIKDGNQFRDLLKKMRSEGVPPTNPLPFDIAKFRRGYEILTPMVASVLGPESAPAFKAMGFAMSYIDNTVSSNFNPKRPGFSSDGPAALSLQVTTKIDSVANAVYDKMKKDSAGFSLFVRELFPEITHGLDPSKSPAQYIKEDPTFASLTGASILVGDKQKSTPAKKPKEQNRLSREAVKSYAERLFSELSEQEKALTRQVNATLKDVIASGSMPSEAQTLPAANPVRPKNQQNDEEQYADRKAVIAGLRGGFYLAQLLAQETNQPKLANEVLRASNTMLIIADSFNEFSHSLKDASALAQGFGSLALTGNIVEAIFSLMGSTQPDPNQLRYEHLSQQLTQLQSTLNDFWKESRQWFVRFDTKLDEVYRVVLKNALAIAENERQEHEIRNSLADLQSDLNTTERKMTELFKSQLDQMFSLEATLVHCLYQRTRNGVSTDSAAMSSTKLEICLNQAWLFSIKSSQSSVAVRAVDQERAFTPARAEALIDERKPWEALSYLAAYTQNRISPSDPSTWMTGALTYIHAAARWPQFVEAVDPEKLQQMIHTGQEIRSSALGLLMQPDAKGEWHFKQETLDTLIANYLKKSADLDRELVQLDSTLRARSDVRAQVQSLNLWKSVDQSFDYKFLNSTIYPSGGASIHGAVGPLQGLPEEFGGAYDYMRLAEGLGLGNTGFVFGILDSSDHRTIRVGYHACFDGNQTLIPNLTSEVPAGDSASGDLYRYQRFFRSFGCTNYTGSAYYGLLDGPAGPGKLNSQWSSVRGDFGSLFGRNRPVGDGANPATERTAFFEDIAELTDKLAFQKIAAHRIFSLRRALIESSLIELSGAGTIKKLAQEVDGARTLLRTFLQISLGKNYTGSQDLVRLTRGGSGLPDSSTINWFYLRSTEGSSGLEAIRTLLAESSYGISAQLPDESSEYSKEFSDESIQELERKSNLFGDNGPTSRINLIRHIRAARVGVFAAPNVPRIIASLREQRVKELREVLQRLNERNLGEVGAIPMIDETIQNLEFLKTTVEANNKICNRPSTLGCNP